MCRRLIASRVTKILTQSRAPKRSRRAKVCPRQLRRKTAEVRYIYRPPPSSSFPHTQQSVSIMWARVRATGSGIKFETGASFSARLQWAIAVRPTSFECDERKGEAIKLDTGAVQSWRNVQSPFLPFSLFLVEFATPTATLRIHVEAFNVPVATSNCGKRAVILGETSKNLTYTRFMKYKIY